MQRICIKNWVLFFLLGLGASAAIFAQKEPQYTQYMYNIGSFNPAYVGTVETAEIAGLYRTQWSGIPGAPKTIRFGVNLPFTNEKTGLGFNVVNDQIGPVSQTFIDIAYSYQVSLSDETKLSFGINAGGSLFDLDFSKGDFEIDNEPLLGTQEPGKFYPTAGIGTFLYAENWYLGVSVPNVLPNSLYDEALASVIDDELQLNMIGGYVFEFSDALKFKPAFLLNYQKGIPLNANVSANFLMGNVFTLGAAYRLDNAVSGLAGFQISNGMFIGYAYDYNTNSLGEFNQGSHEVILKFYLGKGDGSSNRNRKNRNAKGKPKQIDSPRFF